MAVENLVVLAALHLQLILARGWKRGVHENFPNYILVAVLSFG